MGEGPAGWVSTTHDWRSSADFARLEHIRADPRSYAPAGAVHLVLEVLAYAADEAAVTGGAAAVVRLEVDGSIAVVDDGRGTDTRTAADGQVVRKPVMTTRDLRFFDVEPAVLLPDGHPRRGMSVVSALSTWLVHTNRRGDGAWEQHYDHGRPTSELLRVAADSSTGTTVHFRPDPLLVRPATATVWEVEAVVGALAPVLRVRVT